MTTSVIQRFDDISTARNSIRTALSVARERWRTRYGTLTMNDPRYAEASRIHRELEDFATAFEGTGGIMADYDHSSAFAIRSVLRGLERELDDMVGGIDHCFSGEFWDGSRERIVASLRDLRIAVVELNAA